MFHLLLLSFLCSGHGVVGQTSDEVTERAHCSFGPSGDSSGEYPDSSLMMPDHTADEHRCIPLTTENLEAYVHTGCYRFMTEQCYLLNYTLDYVIQDANLNQMDVLLEVTTTDIVLDECKDVIRILVCAFVYPGCNPENGLPEGLCLDECLDYLFQGACAESFTNAVQLGLQSTTDNTFPIRSFECDNPLQYVVTWDSTFINSSHDADNCIKISDYLVLDEPVNTRGNTTIFTTSVIIGTALGVATVIIITAAITLQTLRYKRRKKRRTVTTLRMNDESGLRASLNYTVANSVALRVIDQTLSQANQNYYDRSGQYQLSSDDAAFLSEDLRNALIPFKLVQITGDLGEGAFGMVFKGQLTKKGRKIDVAIKTVKNCNCTAYNEMKGFLNESSIMCSFSHPNVLGMEGICLDSESQTPYLILPFMKNGDLKTYLKNKRDLSQKSSNDFYPEGLSHDTLLEMCYQISCGMEYLASRKLVHRDLAARNCMIDEMLHVKVADFGLTRDIYQQEYYRQSSTGRIPVKWMSPESLSDRISDEKTDVWSFGVTCWEVFSLGRTPYPTLASHDLLEYLEQGLRLKKPVLCKEGFYNIVLLCWKHNPDNRPLFAALSQQISELLPKHHAEEFVEQQVGSPNEEDDYIIMENPLNCTREVGGSLCAYATPPNTPFLLSDCTCSVSQQEESSVLSTGSCQIDDNLASDSEHSETEVMRISNAHVVGKPRSTVLGDTSSSNFTSVTTPVPECSTEFNREVQVKSMEFLSAMAYLTPNIKASVTTAEPSSFDSIIKRGLNRTESTHSNQGGSALGNYVEMKPAIPHT